MPNQPGHLLLSNPDGGDDQVPLVLAVQIIHDDDKLVVLDGSEGLLDCREFERGDGGGGGEAGGDGNAGEELRGR